MFKILKKCWNYLGPGFTSGASEDDPSGIATFSQTGALFGFSQLWLALFTLPFMIILQQICNRIATITSKGIISNLKDQSHSQIHIAICLSLLTIANTINIGANLGAMTSSINLFLPIPFWWLAITCTLAIIFLIIFLNYNLYTTYLKLLAVSLFSYFFTAFFIKLDWQTIIVHSLTPKFKFNKDFVMNILAILGSTISPSIFFWQTNQVIECKNSKKFADHNINAYLRFLKIDTLLGMLFSNFIMWFIIITTASTLHSNGITKINSAMEAAAALKPFAGNFAHLLFAFGIISTGLLSIPILAGSIAYAFAELFNWKRGIDYKFKEAPQFYTIIAIIILVGVLFNLINLDPISLLYYNAIINGIISPPFIFIITYLANNKQIMGGYKNNNFTNILGYSIGFFMILLTILLFALNLY